MANPYFDFKRFRVYHDHCAMKVGTDGVLLGAWSPVSPCGRILDIGSGSGLVSLMIAQRFPNVDVLGVEIDELACRQAVENAANSPFAQQVSFVCADFLTMDITDKFDSIVTNPPYYEEDTLPTDVHRANARHTYSLPISLLVEKSASILCDKGCFAIVLPKQMERQIVAICLHVGLNLSSRLYVRTVERKEPKRVLLCFVKGDSLTTHEETLTLLDTNGKRTKEYSELCSAFYL